MHHDGQEATPYQQKSCWRKADIWLDGEVGSGSPPWRAFAAAKWSAIGPKLPIREVRSMVAFVGKAAGNSVTRRLGL